MMLRNDSRVPVTADPPCVGQCIEEQNCDWEKATVCAFSNASGAIEHHNPTRLLSSLAGAQSPIACHSWRAWMSPTASWRAGGSWVAVTPVACVKQCATPADCVKSCAHALRSWQCSHLAYCCDTVTMFSQQRHA